MFKNGEVLVQKFGGSSMASVERIKNAALRIAEKAKSGYPMVVVVSAMGDTTDDLIALMHRISTFPDRCELDHIMATGEMVSSALMASALLELGVKAKSFNAFNLQLHSKLSNNEYYITDVGALERLESFLTPGSVAVVAGFQGITEYGDLTTLGRGGSDLTAVIMARELGQKVCEKYTDEDGVYTADPRVIPSARKVWHLNYDEMLMLAKFGNGILHPRAISSARDSNIRIHVRSSFSKVEGSVIGPDGDDSVPIKSITCSKKLMYSKIFGANPNSFSHSYPFNNIILQKSDGFIGLGYDKSEAFDAITYCWEKAASAEAVFVENYTNLITITLVGCGLANNGAFVEKVDNVVDNLKPFVKQQDGIRYSLAVSSDKLQESLSCLHSLLKEF